MLDASRRMRKGDGMRGVRRTLVAVTIAVASIGVAAPPASACTEGDTLCATINLVCQTALRRPCLR